MKGILVAVLLSFAASHGTASGVLDWMFPAPVETPVNRAHLTLPDAELRGAPGDPRVSDPRCKSVRNDWTWFSDHLSATVSYVVEGEPGRNYEVGTGVSMFGKPRGGTYDATGKSEVTAFGLGAIHVRARDGMGQMVVCVAVGDIREIEFLNFQF